MVETLFELPLPGRSFAESQSVALGRTPSGMPSFVVGPENALAANVVAGVLDECDDSTSYSVEASSRPLVISIHGASGVGKSHLVRGLVEHWQAVHGDDAACYLPASDFRRELLDALHDDATVEFRRRVRGCQLLAIDELDKLPNERHLLEEFRFLLDDRATDGLLTLVASQHPATRLANLSPDIRSRLSAGLVLPLSAPSPSARAQILLQAAEALGRPLSPEAARRLAADAEDARDLFRSLFELLTATQDTSAIHGDAVRDHLAHRDATRVSLSEIIPVVARYYGLPQKQLKSASRKQSVVLARATIVYLARALAHASYEEIGLALGGRDHSTIMYNYRTIDHERKRDSQLQETLDDLRRLLSVR